MFCSATEDTSGRREKLMGKCKIFVDKWEGKKLLPSSQHSSTSSYPNYWFTQDDLHKERHCTIAVHGLLEHQRTVLADGAPLAAPEIQILSKPAASHCLSSDRAHSHHPEVLHHGSFLKVQRQPTAHLNADCMVSGYCIVLTNQWRSLVKKKKKKELQRTSRPVRMELVDNPWTWFWACFSSNTRKNNRKTTLRSTALAKTTQTAA